MFSLTRFWPIYSASVLGRTLASRRASSSNEAPETMRWGCALSSRGRWAIIRLAVPSAIYSLRSALGHSRSFSFLSGERLQRNLKKFFEVCNADFTLGFSGSVFRGASIVTEVDERGDDVGFDSGGRSYGRFLFCDGHGFEFVFEFDDHAFGGFSADTRNSRKADEIVAADGGNQFLGAHTG